MLLAENDVETGEASGGDASKAQGETGATDSINSSQQQQQAHHVQSSTLKSSRKWSSIFVCLVLLLGIFASSLFLTVGIKSKKNEQNARFERQALDLTKQLSDGWHEYVVVALWLYQAACGMNRTITRTGFKIVYEHITAYGLELKAASCVYNITHDERQAAEDESRAYFENYPTMNYSGFTGLQEDPQTGKVSVAPREEQPFYFPVRLGEPVEGNEMGFDFDIFSNPSRRATIESALANWRPEVTPRVRLVQETETDAYSVILMHPGIPVKTEPNRKPRDLANLVIRIPDLLRRSVQNNKGVMDVYIFDSSYLLGMSDDFLGGASVSGANRITFLEETALSSLRNSKHLYEEKIPVASGEWTIVVVSNNSIYDANLTFVIVGAVMILAICAFIAFFIFTSMRRVAKVGEMEIEAEKAGLLIDSQEAAISAERELNEFIAHEVRNPLSVAMSALSFVTSEVNTEPPLVDAVSKQSVRDDLGIIKGSLTFINDLLRSMLDMQRAASNQMKIHKGPTDLRKDVLDPVVSMLYQRGLNYEVLLDCPSNLMVMTDRLRLTQVVMNLARNSSKFVNVGFIRLRAEVINGSNIHVSVEDSGPGIPKAKHNALFAKFQESLDSLSQGTGIGLCLCKKLVDLMGGEIWLDETYDSNVEGCIGARFVVSLNTAPLSLNSDSLDAYESSSAYKSDPNTSAHTDVETCRAESALVSDSSLNLLPTKLSMVIVDDDPILRKLFLRAVSRVNPGWDIQEAANGEAVLSLVESHTYDLIFVDQYMASVDVSLLGTETVSALRAKGVQSRICGLSANDMKTSFLNAGADFFLLKPFPTNKDALTQELERLLTSERNWSPK